jgi:hypothetical protein
MRTRALPAAVLTAFIAMTPVAVRGDDSTRDGAPIVFNHPELRAALARIERGSPSWRASMTAIAEVGRRIILLTPAQVLVRETGSSEPVGFDASAVAEVSPVVAADGRVDDVVVVVNVDRLQELHDQRRSLPGEFHADLDRVLAHEVYGHAVPYLLAGHVSGRCADPQAGQPAMSSCAIGRENVIRGELRLGRRTDSSLLSLNLARALSWR